MKRILAFVLCLCTLLSLVACDADEANKTQTLDSTQTKEEKKTEEKIEETKEVVFSTIEKPMVPEDITKIPIANSSMTTDELRQICLDFLALQVSFPWMCTKTYSYTVPSQKYPVTYEAGTIYAGVPYVNKSSGNVYRWMEYYNSETGVVDLINNFAMNNELFGTACSGTACWAWGRVINSAKYSWTSSMNIKHGFIPVGDYKYDPATDVYGKDGFLDCKPITRENGEQVMYESYAKMLPADCLVSNGHVRLCASKPVVVRDEATGKIDGNKSYTTYSDQGMYRDQTHQIRTQSDGTQYSIQGSVNAKITFAELYNAGCLPHTFAEFLGTDPVEDASVTLGLNSNSATLADISASTMVSNYAISDVFCVVKDENGKQIYRYVKRSDYHYRYTWEMSFLPVDAFKKYADGNHTIEITVQVSNGAKPVAYSGALIG